MGASGDSLMVRVRRGEGPVFGAIKAVAKRVLCVSVPVVGPLKPVFAALYWAHVTVREGRIWAVRFFWYEPIFRSQCAAVGGRFRMEGLPYISGRGRIVIGEGVRLSGRCLMRFSNRRGAAQPELVIGDGTFVAHNVSFDVAGSVRVGRNCLIATDVGIREHDGHPLDAERRRKGEQAPPEGVKPVAIGDDVWIGAGALILKGVKIGDRAVVAAHAVVTKDVPADVVVAGNPARVVKALGEGASAVR